MRRIAMKGGALSAEQIEKILGELFQKFIGLIEDGDLSVFQIKNVTTHKFTPRTGEANPDDLHPDFIQYLVAMATALRDLEQPLVGKRQIRTMYGQKFSSIVDKLIKGDTGIKILDKNKIGVLGFLYNENPNFDPEIKFLVPGFNMLGTNEKVFKPETDETNFVNLILYLCHFIAFLDVTNLTGDQVVYFLLENEHYYFGRALNGLVKEISTPENFKAHEELERVDSSVIAQGVRAGFISVAQKIIEEYSEMDKQKTTGERIVKPIKDIVDAGITGKLDTGPDQTKFVDEVLKAAAPKGLGLTANWANDLSLSMAYIGWTTPANEPDAKVKAIATLKDLPKDYTVTGFYNPWFLKDANVYADYNPAPGGVPVSTIKKPTTFSGPRTFTGKKKGGYNESEKEFENIGSMEQYNNGYNQQGGAPEVNSANFLYGPEDTTDTNKKHLLTVNQIKTNADTRLVTLASLDAAERINNALKGPLSASGRDSNLARALVLGLTYYYVKNGKKVWANNQADVAKIKETTNKILDEYALILPRIHFLQTTDAKKIATDSADAFVQGFMTELGEALTEPLRPPYVSKERKTNTLETFKNLYKNIMLPRKEFYDRFFNLVDTQTNKSEPLHDVADDDYYKYRLNVKRQIGYESLTGGQRGGVWGDITVISFVPPWQPRRYGAAWIDLDDKYTVNELQAAGVEVFRAIVRSIFNQPPTSIETTIFGHVIRFEAIAGNVALVGEFSFDLNKYMREKLARARLTGVAGIPSHFTEFETKMREHMFARQTDWVRENQTFVRRKPDGTLIESNVGDYCELMGISADECFRFFEYCMTDDRNDLGRYCLRVLDTDYPFFDIHLPMTKIAESVKKMNPKAALHLLSKFGFGYSIQPETVPPLRNLNRKKVQSVGSWIQLLNTDKIKKQLATAGPDPNTIIRQITEKTPFLNYLQVLVDWVNANPQALNEEEDKPSGFERGCWLKTNKEYNLYHHINPYKPVIYRLYGICDGLTRLKSTIINDLAGFSGPTMVSNIASIPSASMQMPLNRSAFQTTVPGLNLGIMYGGNQYAIGLELQKLSEPYGANLFRSVFEDLKATMNRMGGDKERMMKLTQHSQNMIAQKLDTFEQLEKDIIQSLGRMIEKNKLYTASYGIVNPYNVEDYKLKDLLAKHSNLLGLTATYNKKALNLIDIFRTFTTALIGKMEEKTPTQEYTRPLNMGLREDFDKYHVPQQSNFPQ